jgi:hypothetical protein
MNTKVKGTPSSRKKASRPSGQWSHGETDPWTIRLDQFLKKEKWREELGATFERRREPRRRSRKILKLFTEDHAIIGLHGGKNSPLCRNDQSISSER